ncbi:MAG: tetratricopeptide repeat protein [Polyangiaceae bacterium]
MKVETCLRLRRVRRALFALVCSWATLTLTPGALASPAPAADAATEVAHLALAEGRYKEAEADYEALIRDHRYSALLLYNLGNAYLRDGQAASALLAYERARVLTPRDRAIATNLAAARAALGLPQEDSAPDRFSRLLTMNTWAWTAAGAFWVAVATVGAAVLSKRHRAFMIAGAALAAVGGAVSGGALLVSSRDLDRGLVMAAVPVLVSPFESAQSGFSLVPGEDVDLGRCRERYVFVHDAHGRSGWVESVQVARLIPLVVSLAERSW